MDTVSKVLFSVYGIALLIVLVILVYLIVKRIDTKEREDFEKRSN